MDTPTPAPAAPAQPATVSAAMDAASRGDFSAFDAAHVSARQGTPVAPVPSTAPAPSEPAASAPAPGAHEPAPSEPASPAPPERKLSNRQQQINDYERRIAEQDLRIKALESRQGQPAPTTPAAPATPAEPAYRRIAALPNAPKLSDPEFDNPNGIAEHAAAMALFVHQTIAAESRGHVEHAQAEQFTHARVEAFDAQVTTLEASEPGITAKILPLAQRLGAAKGPEGILGTIALDSPVGAKALAYLQDHPDELARLTTPPPHLRGMAGPQLAKVHIPWMAREFGKLEARLEAPSAPAVPAPAQPAPSPISSAPPPPPLVTGAGTTADPEKAAIERGDFGSFDRIQVQKMRAKRGQVA